MAALQWLSAATVTSPVVPDLLRRHIFEKHADYPHIAGLQLLEIEPQYRVGPVSPLSAGRLVPGQGEMGVPREEGLNRSLDELRDGRPGGALLPARLGQE